MAGKTKRDDELSKRPAIKKRALELYTAVQKGFEEQRRRADTTLDHWALYNLRLSDRQFYSGNSKIYLPRVHANASFRDEPTGPMMANGPRRRTSNFDKGRVVEMRRRRSHTL